MTVLIADDNALIRNWLKIMLRQEEGDKITLLEAADGDEAYEICMREQIDLLITDIRMPGRDGIELLNALREERPSIRAAVLTSFDDFSYIRVALKCGALDYILKAEMQQEDISSLMAKVRESLALSNTHEPRKSTYHSRISAARVAYDAIQQNNAASPLPLIRACALEESDFPAHCMLANLGDSACDVEYAAEVCCDVLRMEKMPGLFFPIGGKSLLALYALPKDSMAPESELQLRLFSAIDQNLSFADAGGLCQNVSLVLERPEAFSATLRQTKVLVDYQCYYQTSVLPEGGIPPHSPKEGEFLQILSSYLARQDRQRTVNWLQTYVSDCHQRMEFPYRIRRAVTTGIQMMINSLAFRSNQAEIYHRLDQIAQELNETRTADRLCCLVDQFCAGFLEYQDAGQKTISPAIEQAMAFCKEHYSEKITLIQLAELTGLNKSYFSQLFHKETGVPFGDYLESVRIRNAQRLLHNLNLSMSDIAELVGFSNQNYFTKVFKKQTGIAPSQYRRRIFQADAGAGGTAADSAPGGGEA